MKLFTVTLLAFAFLTVPSLADTLIVDPGGSGDATTIQGGLDLAFPGDEVQVMPGTYVENVVVPSAIRLRGISGPEVTIIDGNGDTCVQCIECQSGTLVEGFTLTGGGGDAAGAMWIYDYSHVEVANCIVRDNITSYQGAGIQVQRYSYGYIHDCRFLNNQTLHACAIVVIVHSIADIENNQFKDNVSDFLSAGVGVNMADVTISGNVFLFNHSVHGAVIHVVGPGTTALVSHNTFLFNHGASDGGSGIYAYSGAMMYAYNNIFAWNTGTPAVKCSNATMILGCNDVWENDIDYFGLPDPTGTNGNLRTDPLVCDPVTDDAALSHYSPLLAGPCGVVGANPTPDCDDAVPTVALSWSQVKTLYR